MTEQHRQEGLFTVEIWSWEEIWHELYGRPALLRRIKPVYWPLLTGLEAGACRADISRILKYAPAELIGREDRTQAPERRLGKRRCAWRTRRPHVLTFVALGGEGKTSLVAKWAAELASAGLARLRRRLCLVLLQPGHARATGRFLRPVPQGGPDLLRRRRRIKAFAASPAGAFEKGQRLAHLVGQRRSLLILDGLEPLQYAPTSPTPGELKDQGIAALLKGLAAASHGLCVVTTRYSLPDLKAFWQTTAPEVKLLRLSRDAGVHLLKTLGVTRHGAGIRDAGRGRERPRAHPEPARRLPAATPTRRHPPARPREAGEGRRRRARRPRLPDAWTPTSNGSCATAATKAGAKWPCCGSWACSTGPPTPTASPRCWSDQPSPASPNRSPGLSRRRFGILPHAASKPRSCSR